MKACAMGRVNGPVDRSRNSDVYINERPRGIKNCPCCTPPSGTSSRKLSSTYSPRRSHCEIRTCVLSISSTRDWNTGSARFGCSPASGMANCSSNSQTSLSASSLTNTHWTHLPRNQAPTWRFRPAADSRPQRSTRVFTLAVWGTGLVFIRSTSATPFGLRAPNPQDLVQFIQLDQRKRLASDFASASHAEG
jgi:hypothetical protein